MPNHVKVEPFWPQRRVAADRATDAAVEAREVADPADGAEKANRAAVAQAVAGAEEDGGLVI